MSRDESAYPDAERFFPDRFLKNGRINTSVRDPMSYMLGFGRRYVVNDWNMTEYS